jgi:hypothetical protein
MPLYKGYILIIQKKNRRVSVLSFELFICKNIMTSSELQVLIQIFIKTSSLEFSNIH